MQKNIQIISYKRFEASYSSTIESLFQLKTTSFFCFSQDSLLSKPSGVCIVSSKVQRSNQQGDSLFWIWWRNVFRIRQGDCCSGSSYRDMLGFIKKIFVWNVRKIEQNSALWALPLSGLFSHANWQQHKAASEKDSISYFYCLIFNPHHYFEVWNAETDSKYFFKFLVLKC